MSKFYALALQNINAVIPNFIPAEIKPSSSIWSMTLTERQNAAILLQSTTLRPFIYMSFPFRFKCFYCDEVCPEINTLLDHTNSHNVPDTLAMMKSYLPKGKKKIKVDISELKCKICDTPFPNIDDVRCHLVHDHDKKFNMDAGNGMVIYNLKIEDGVFSCHLCNEKFRSFFLLNKHINVHFNNAICEQCGKCFVSYQRLQQHKETHLKGTFYCEKCKKLFDTLAKFKYHNKRVHGKPNKVSNIYNCQHCAARFDHYYEKVRHMSEEHGIHVNFSCEFCKVVFSTTKALARHRMKYHIHKITCEICQKPFAERNHLSKHMAIHTEERAFPCPLCSKRYKYEKNVKVHMKIHNPNWKFACAECFVGFTLKTELKKHLSERHAETRVVDKT